MVVGRPGQTLTYANLVNSIQSLRIALDLFSQAVELASSFAKKRFEKALSQYWISVLLRSSAGCSGGGGEEETERQRRKEVCEQK